MSTTFGLVGTIYPYVVTHFSKGWGAQQEKRGAHLELPMYKECSPSKLLCSSSSILISQLLQAINSSCLVSLHPSPGEA